MCNKIKTVIKENTDKQNKLSFAETVKKYRAARCIKTSSSNNKAEGNTKNLKAKQHVNNNFDLNVNLNITNIENKKNGTIIFNDFYLKCFFLKK